MVIKVSVPGQFQFKLLPTVRNLMFAGQSEVHYIGHRPWIRKMRHGIWND